MAVKEYLFDFVAKWIFYMNEKKLKTILYFFGEWKIRTYSSNHMLHSLFFKSMAIWYYFLSDGLEFKKACVCCIAFLGLIIFERRS